jgi:hypothetical protein
MDRTGQGVPPAATTVAREISLVRVRARTADTDRWTKLQRLRRVHHYRPILVNAARKSGANIFYYVAHVDYIQYIGGLKPIREGVIFVISTATTAAGELRAYATTTSDHAHCILKLILSNVLQMQYSCTFGTYNYNRSLRAPRRAEGSFGHTQLGYF